MPPPCKGGFTSFAPEINFFRRLLTVFNIVFKKLDREINDEENIVYIF